MSLDADEEILQDFLVEAGELLEQLSEQLVDLEHRPEDQGLLNAIFRGFHTVKGGAGFLQLGPLVDLCHVAENVFDCLRNGKLQVDTELMDVVLQALDSVNVMFGDVSSRQMPEPAESSLLQSLQKLVNVGNDEAPAPSASEATPETPAEHASDTCAQQQTSAQTSAQGSAQTASVEISDGQFQDFVQAIGSQPQEATGSENGSVQAKSLGAQTPSHATIESSTDKGDGSDEISDAEFDALMNELHGVGKGPTGAASKSEISGDTQNQSATPDEITDSEFDQLLDELHGNGKGPSAATAQSATGAQDPSLIADAEFDSLLDDLHGEGQGPSVKSTEKSTSTLSPKSASGKTMQSVDQKQRNYPEKQTSAPTPPARDANAAVRPTKEAAQAETTVRVDTKRLDDIMNMVGELVLVRNRLVRLGIKSTDESMSKAVANLDVVTADLQTAVMKTRMQPIKKVFGRFPRVVRDLARSLKKEINLELQGEDTDLDKNLVEALADPLVHLVRNSVDHGIEAPDVREQAGKRRSGKIILAAQQEGDHIVLSISDDGGGMDADVLRRKAVEKNLMDEEAAERLTDHDAFNLIFHPGFSTKDVISDVSGRGVGMDVVKTKITQLNGTIDVQSKRGQGTVIAIKVPLTLAIMPTLMVMLEQQTFALPLVSVNEIFHLDLSKTNVVDGQEVVIVRDKALPLFHLKRWLVNGGAESTTAHVVIVSVGTQKVGFVVDQLIGQEEVVIKPLGRMLNGTAGMAGATITGDGRIALILDVPSMLKRYAGQY